MSPVHPVHPTANTENATFHSISAKMHSNNHISNNNNNNHSAYYKSKNREGDQNESALYLNRLVNFKTIMGVTYFGRQFMNYPNACLRPVLVSSLVFYDLLCVSAMMYLEFYAFNQFVYSRLFRHTTSKLTMSIIFRSTGKLVTTFTFAKLIVKVGYCIFIEYLCIKLLTLLRGPPLIKSVIELGKHILFHFINATINCFVNCRSKCAL